MLWFSPQRMGTKLRRKVDATSQCRWSTNCIQLRRHDLPWSAAIQSASIMVHWDRHLQGYLRATSITHPEKLKQWRNHLPGLTWLSHALTSASSYSHPKQSSSYQLTRALPIGNPKYFEEILVIDHQQARHLSPRSSRNSCVWRDVQSRIEMLVSTFHRRRNMHLT